jgi:hypothetical protein
VNPLDLNTDNMTRIDAFNLYMPRRVTFVPSDKADSQQVSSLLFFHDYLMHYESEEESILRVKEAIGAPWITKVGPISEKVLEIGSEKKLIKNITKA